MPQANTRSIVDGLSVATRFLDFARNDGGAVPLEIRLATRAMLLSTSRRLAHVARLSRQFIAAGARQECSGWREPRRSSAMNDDTRRCGSLPSSLLGALI